MNMRIAVEIESVIFRIVINDHLNIYSLEYIIAFWMQYLLMTKVLKLCLDLRYCQQGGLTQWHMRLNETRLSNLKQHESDPASFLLCEDRKKHASVWRIRRKGMQDEI